MSDREEGQTSGMNRADFVKRLAAGAFAVPVITSFAMDGLAQASVGQQWPNQSQGNQTTPPDHQHPNQSYPNQQWPNQSYPNQGGGEHSPSWPPVRPGQDERRHILKAIFRLFGHRF